MPAEPCHSPASDARDLLLRVLGVANVARWCRVSEGAVYQWLHRGTPEAPIPSQRAPAIAQGAVAEGLDFDMALIWPAMSGWSAQAFARPAQHVRAREDVQ